MERKETKRISPRKLLTSSDQERKVKVLRSDKKKHEKGELELEKSHNPKQEVKGQDDTYKEVAGPSKPFDIKDVTTTEEPGGIPQNPKVTKGKLSPPKEFQKKEVIRPKLKEVASTAQDVTSHGSEEKLDHKYKHETSLKERKHQLKGSAVKPGPSKDSKTLHKDVSVKKKQLEAHRRKIKFQKELPTTFASFPLFKSMDEKSGEAILKSKKYGPTDKAVITSPEATRFEEAQIKVDKTEKSLRERLICKGNIKLVKGRRDSTYIVPLTTEDKDNTVALQQNDTNTFTPFGQDKAETKDVESQTSIEHTSEKKKTCDKKIDKEVQTEILSNLDVVLLESEEAINTHKHDPESSELDASKGVKSTETSIAVKKSEKKKTKMCSKKVQTKECAFKALRKKQLKEDKDDGLETFWKDLDSMIKGNKKEQEGTSLANVELSQQEEKKYEHEERFHDDETKKEGLPAPKIEPQYPEKQCMKKDLTSQNDENPVTQTIDIGNNSVKIEPSTVTEHESKETTTSSTPKVYKEGICVKKESQDKSNDTLDGTEIINEDLVNKGSDKDKLKEDTAGETTSTKTELDQSKPLKTLEEVSPFEKDRCSQKKEPIQYTDEIESKGSVATEATAAGEKEGAIKRHDGSSIYLTTKTASTQISGTETSPKVEGETISKETELDPNIIHEEKQEKTKEIAVGTDEGAIHGSSDNKAGEEVETQVDESKLDLEKTKDIAIATDEENIDISSDKRELRDTDEQMAKCLDSISADDIAKDSKEVPDKTEKQEMSLKSVPEEVTNTKEQTENVIPISQDGDIKADQVPSFTDQHEDKKCTKTSAKQNLYGVIEDKVMDIEDKKLIKDKQEGVEVSVGTDDSESEPQGAVFPEENKDDQSEHKKCTKTSAKQNLEGEIEDKVIDIEDEKLIKDKPQSIEVSVGTDDCESATQDAVIPEGNKEALKKIKKFKKGKVKKNIFIITQDKNICTDDDHAHKSRVDDADSISIQDEEPKTDIPPFSKDVRIGTTDLFGTSLCEKTINILTKKRKIKNKTKACNTENNYFDDIGELMEDEKHKTRDETREDKLIEEGSLKKGDQKESIGSAGGDSKKKIKKRPKDRKAEKLERDNGSVDLTEMKELSGVSALVREQATQTDNPTKVKLKAMRRNAKDYFNKLKRIDKPLRDNIICPRCFSDHKKPTEYEKLWFGPFSDSEDSMLRLKKKKPIKQKKQKKPKKVREKPLSQVVKENLASCGGFMLSLPRLFIFPGQKPEELRFLFNLVLLRAIFNVWATLVLIMDVILIFYLGFYWLRLYTAWVTFIGAIYFRDTLLVSLSHSPVPQHIKMKRKYDDLLMKRKRDKEEEEAYKEVFLRRKNKGGGFKPEEALEESESELDFFNFETSTLTKHDPKKSHHHPKEWGRRRKLRFKERIQNFYYWLTDMLKPTLATYHTVLFVFYVTHTTRYTNLLHDFADSLGHASIILYVYNSIFGLTILLDFCIALFPIKLFYFFLPFSIFGLIMALGEVLTIISKGDEVYTTFIGTFNPSKYREDGLNTIILMGYIAAIMWVAAIPRYFIVKSLFRFMKIRRGHTYRSEPGDERTKEKYIFV